MGSPSRSRSRSRSPSPRDRSRSPERERSASAERADDAERRSRSPERADDAERRSRSRSRSHSRSHSRDRRSRSRSRSRSHDRHRSRRSRSRDRPVPAPPTNGGVGSTEEKKESSCLFVGNISYRATERDVGELFDRYGPLRYVKLATNRQTGEPKGFGFVDFEHRRDAEDALRALSGFNFMGRALRVDFDVGLDRKHEMGHLRRGLRRSKTPEHPHGRSMRGSDRGFGRDRGYGRDRGHDRGYDRDYDRGYGRGRSPRRGDSPPSKRRHMDDYRDDMRA